MNVFWRCIIRLIILLLLGLYPGASSQTNQWYLIPWFVVLVMQIYRECLIWGGTVMLADGLCNYRKEVCYLTSLYLFKLWLPYCAALRFERTKD